MARSARRQDGEQAPVDLGTLVRSAPCAEGRNATATDFVLGPRPIALGLLAGRAHYDVVMPRLAAARRSVWIATANLKDLMVEGPRGARSRDRFCSVLEIFDRLAADGVELRLLHAGAPSRAFRRSFDRHPRLTGGGLELRQCPRVHFKTVIVDGEFCYLGSANWTGAGLGAKGAGRRNFELGFVGEDEDLIDQVQELFVAVWGGSQCAGCRLRADGCEAPLDL